MPAQPNPYTLMFLHQLQAEPGEWKRYPVEKIHKIKRPGMLDMQKVANSIRVSVSTNRGSFHLDNGGKYEVRLRARDRNLRMRYIPPVE